MKLKYLLAACTAFFLVSCSNDDELPQLPQHGDIVGLNIKDAKYIYTSGTNTRSSAAQYRQIKKDGRDMELSWIDDKGDTVRINDLSKIWDINESIGISYITDREECVCHFQASRAVACDNLHLHANAHLGYVNVFICNRDFLGISCCIKKQQGSSALLNFFNKCIHCHIRFSFSVCQ